MNEITNERHGNIEARVRELIDENVRLKATNAILMGDDEDKPRYTTKRLRHEIAQATATLTAERDALNDQLAVLLWASEQAVLQNNALCTEVDRLSDRKNRLVEVLKAIVDFTEYKPEAQRIDVWNIRLAAARRAVEGE